LAANNTTIMLGRMTEVQATNRKLPGNLPKTGCGGLESPTAIRNGRQVEDRPTTEPRRCRLMRGRLGRDQAMVRAMTVGIENPDDLLTGLDQALS
jgi:hypothetical protein